MGTVVNVCFHGIGEPRRDLEDGEAPYWVRSETYLRILDVLAADPRVRISFDDGNLSDLDRGLPGLLERGLDATFFVLADRLDTPGSLSREDVRALDAAGMRVGSHGAAHRPWRGLHGADLHAETVQARDELSRVVGHRVDEAALPLGRYDRALLGHLRAQGFTRVHTSDRTWARESAWLQPRFSVRSHDTPASVREEMLRAGRLHRAERAVVTRLKRLR